MKPMHPGIEEVGTPGVDFASSRITVSRGGSG